MFSFQKSLKSVDIVLDGVLFLIIFVIYFCLLFMFIWLKILKSDYYIKCINFFPFNNYLNYYLPINHCHHLKWLEGHYSPSINLSLLKILDQFCMPWRLAVCIIVWSVMSWTVNSSLPNQINNGENCPVAWFTGGTIDYKKQKYPQRLHKKKILIFYLLNRRKCYLQNIFLFLFYFDKNQFQFELENIYKKINLCFKRKFLNLFKKTLQFIF